MLDKQRILRDFEDSQKILMITCPGCACESLSYSENLPCRSIMQGKDMEQSAIAIHQVRDRWDRLLKELGKEVKHLTVAFPCGMFDTDRELIIESLDNCDTVAVLGCSSAFIGIKDTLDPFHSGKFVPMMKTTGTFVLRLVKDETGENSIVDQDSARIIYNRARHKEE